MGAKGFGNVNKIQNFTTLTATKNSIKNKVIQKRN